MTDDLTTIERANLKIAEAQNWLDTLKLAVQADEDNALAVSVHLIADSALGLLSDARNLIEAA